MNSIVLDRVFYPYTFGLGYLTVAIVADVKTGRVGNAPSSCYNLGLSRIRRSTRQHDGFRRSVMANRKSGSSKLG